MKGAPLRSLAMIAAPVHLGLPCFRHRKVAVDDHQRQETVAAALENLEDAVDGLLGHVHVRHPLQAMDQGRRRRMIQRNWERAMPFPVELLVIDLGPSSVRGEDPSPPPAAT